MKKIILLLLFFSSVLFSQTPVKGVWLTNVDSKVLNSKEGIEEAVSLCKELGINTIYMVVWNKGFTLYPSKVMKDFCGAEIIPDFAGRDPLKELIEAAHKVNIKIYAWFEFGFSSSYNLDGGIILKLKPEWKAIDRQGNLVKKNGFEWMNGFNPEVQSFMLSLIEEVIHNYDIDGIQGDDRLPAMPSEAGYDSYTVSMYKRMHKGITPPDDPKDSAWVQWRADILNNFMRRIHDAVKSYKKDIVVSMAPSIYPWSKEEYLQDWVMWVKEGLVDQICPQLYRYDFEAYKSTLELIINEQINKKNLDKFYPGILLKVGKYQPDEQYLKKVIELNRKNNVKGEVFFFYEGFKKYPELIKSLINN